MKLLQAFKPRQVNGGFLVVQVIQGLYKVRIGDTNRLPEDGKDAPGALGGGENDVVEWSVLRFFTASAVRAAMREGRVASGVIMGRICAVGSFAIIATAGGRLSYCHAPIDLLDVLGSVVRCHRRRRLRGVAPHNSSRKTSCFSSIRAP
jgi:hypothetical protein